MQLKIKGYILRTASMNGGVLKPIIWKLSKLFEGIFNQKGSLRKLNTNLKGTGIKSTYIWILILSKYFGTFKGIT